VPFSVGLLLQLQGRCLVRIAHGTGAGISPGSPPSARTIDAAHAARAARAVDGSRKPCVRSCTPRGELSSFAAAPVVSAYPETI